MYVQSPEHMAWTPPSFLAGVEQLLRQVLCGDLEKLARIDRPIVAIDRQGNPTLSRAKAGEYRLPTAEIFQRVERVWKAAGDPVVK
jgi:hypothetical protein